jgi:hypothetical protein
MTLSHCGQFLYKRDKENILKVMMSFKPNALGMEEVNNHREENISKRSHF